MPGEAAVGPHVHHSHNHSDHHDHDHAHGEGVVWHSHGWGTYHAHRLDFVTHNRPTLGVLLALGIAGGILPDPTALALLLAALSSGKVLLGLLTVVVFSLGFAATLVVVGIVAAKVGQRVLGLAQQHLGGTAPDRDHAAHPRRRRRAHRAGGLQPRGAARLSGAALPACVVGGSMPT